MGDVCVQLNVYLQKLSRLRDEGDGLAVAVRRLADQETVARSAAHALGSCAENIAAVQDYRDAQVSTASCAKPEVRKCLFLLLFRYSVWRAKCSASCARTAIRVPLQRYLMVQSTNTQMYKITKCTFCTFAGEREEDCELKGQF